MIGRLAAISVVMTIILAPQPSHAARYYVSSSGDDAKTGRDLSNAWRTLQRTSSVSFRGGDSLLIEGGKAFDGYLNFTEDDTGTPQKPVVVTSYGTGRATIRAGTGPGLTVHNTAGIVIENLAFEGTWSSSTQTGNNDYGISINTDKKIDTTFEYVRIRDCAVSGFKKSGIALWAWPSDNNQTGFAGFRDVRIEKCVSHDNGDAGISSFANYNPASGKYGHRNVKVVDCIAYGNKGILNKGGNSGSGIVLSGVDTGLIERCISYDNGALNNFTGGGPVGIWCWEARNMVIQFNESYANKTMTADGGGFDFDGGTSKSVMQYNYSHDNAGPGYLIYQFSGARPLTDNTVRYNISRNDGHGILVGGGTDVKRNLLYQNTIYNTRNGSVGIKFWSVGEGHVVINNIFATAGDQFEVHEDLVGRVRFAGNAYHAIGATGIKGVWKVKDALNPRGTGTLYTSLAVWRTETGQETLDGNQTGINADPQFLNAAVDRTVGDPQNLPDLDNFTLRTTSPLINKGVAYGAFSISPGSRDFRGIAAPQNGNFDIGACEYVAPTAIASPSPRRTRNARVRSMVHPMAPAEAGRDNLLLNGRRTGFPYAEKEKRSHAGVVEY